MISEPRTRRTWPQRILLVAGLLVAAGCFTSAKIVWDAEEVLTSLGRIRVDSDVLESPGSPGDPLTFLIVGVDSSEGLDENDPVRAGRDVESEANGRFLPDTILVARLDPATGSIDLLSIPRDLYVTVPGSSEWKINSSLVIGGMGTLIETIDANLGIQVNHFVVVNFAGFSDIVDLIDGVPVYFPYPTRDIPSRLTINEPGCWILDGSESLSYVRARSLEEQIDGDWVPLHAAAPDLARIERQQEFMVLALEQALELGGSDFGRVRSFVDAGAQAVRLDELLTPGDLIDLAQAFQEFDTEELETATLPVSPLFGDDGRYLGEQLQVVEAEAVLASFTDPDSTDRPESIDVSIVGMERDRDRVISEVTDRGFNATAGISGAAVDQTNTILTFHRLQIADARLFARYLEVAPVLNVLSEEGPEAEMVLTLGADFAGVRTFPRPNRELDNAFTQARDNVGRAIGEPEQTADAAATTTTLGVQPDASDASEAFDEAEGQVDDETSDELSNGSDTDDSIDSELDSLPSAVSNDPKTTTVVPTTVVRGRAPAEASCQNHDG